MKTANIQSGEKVTVTTEIRNFGHGEQVKVIYRDGSEGWEHVSDLQEDKKTDEFVYAGIDIFKQGVTECPVSILRKAGEPFDREAKINFYKSLGYTVTTWQ